MESYDRGGNAWLLRFIESPHFTMFRCISYLEQYASNVGIHFYLCQKLRKYPKREIEFFLPQLVQLQVTVETESMALEDLLLDLCNDSTHCTLLVFWQLQAHLAELSHEPETYAFHVCKRLYNRIQYLLFNVGEPPVNALRENTQPALILSSAIAAAIGVPQLGEFIKPLAVSQGRKQRSHIFHLASKLLRSKSASQLKGKALAAHNDASTSTPNLNNTDKTRPKFDKEASLRVRSMDGVYGTASLPDVSNNLLHARHSPAPSISSQTSVVSTAATTNTSLVTKPNPLLSMTEQQKIKALRTNYFRCETQFVYALHAISSRLLQVPKQARLSALKAELALLNRDLPAEVDIPMLLPTDGKQNRVVRIAPAEATVLNSAERVPFLLLIEYLHEDVDFDPETDVNKELLMKDEAERRYIFDLAYLHNQKTDKVVDESTLDNNDVEEKDLGDLSSMPLTRRETYQHDTLAASVQSLSVNREQKNPSSPRPSDLVFSSHYRPATPVHTPTIGQPAVDVTDIATHMRTAAIMLTQLDAGNGKLTKAEIENIKSKIIASMQSMEQNTIFGDTIQGEAGERKLENDLKTAGMSSSDDPSAANLGEDWTLRKERIRRSSPYGHLPNWDLFSVIAKTGDDLRQEAFACQLILAIRKAWIDSEVDVWVKEMRILITNDTSGLVETITNGLSIHSIKKALTAASIKSGKNPKGAIASLTDHFEQKFGPVDSERYFEAQNAFVRSLAASSVICYILQIKDRHNGNILLDSDGHIIHIDFGFLLSNSPGRFGFEAAPFKLTQEYVDVMGGVDSPMFELFRSLLIESFKALRKNAESIIVLVEMMARDSNLPCFYSGPATALQLRQRFQLHMSESEIDAFVDNVLIQKSVGSLYTRLYDQYQLLTQGIYS